MYGVLFTLPSANQMMASTGEYATPIVNDFLPFIFLVIGIVLGLSIVAILVYVTSGTFIHGKK